MCQIHQGTMVYARPLIYYILKVINRINVMCNSFQISLFIFIHIKCIESEHKHFNYRYCCSYKYCVWSKISIIVYSFFYHVAFGDGLSHNKGFYTYCCNCGFAHKHFNEVHLCMKSVNHLYSFIYGWFLSTSGNKSMIIQGLYLLSS
jgi:hypothetical protein